MEVCDIYCDVSRVCSPLLTHLIHLTPFRLILDVVQFRLNLKTAMTGTKQLECTMLFQVTIEGCVACRVFFVIANRYSIDYKAFNF